MMKRQNKQKGATLLELVVGMAITGLIVLGVVGLIGHEMRSTATARACVTVSDEIENAARWISHDGMMAENTNLIVDTLPVNDLTLSWVERYEFLNVPHNCSYYLSGNELCRNYDGTVTTVARHISGIKFSRTGDCIQFSISCTPPWIGQSRTVEKTYRVYLRSANQG